jgi:hypothetical protein
MSRGIIYVDMKERRRRQDTRQERFRTGRKPGRRKGRGRKMNELSVTPGFYRQKMSRHTCPRLPSSVFQDKFPSEEKRRGAREVIGRWRAVTEGERSKKRISTEAEMARNGSRLGRKEGETGEARKDRMSVTIARCS